MNYLASQLMGNTVQQWLIAAAITIVVALVLATAWRFVKVRLTAWAATTEGKFDDAVADMFGATRRWFIVVVGLVAGAQTLTLPARVDVALWRIFMLAVVLQVGLWLNSGIGGWVKGHVEARRNVDATGATTASILGFIAKVALWSLVLLMGLQNFGVDITALVASLGIGGIAVALALQTILGDIFASLAIALDKPVVIGDFIVLGDIMGSVERVGLKTTHLRSLSGELIVLPNSDLLASRVRNYKRMMERRVLFCFGVTYETPTERLQALPGVVREIVERDPMARFDRAHLARFADSALEYEVVYYVKDPDYNKYMDAQQRINFALIENLRETGVEFAYPTRTIHMVTPVGKD